MTHLIIYMLSSIGVLATSIIGPAMGEINLFFHDVDPTLVKLVMTISALFVIPSTYLSIYLYTKFGKKNTLLFALTVYFISGSMAGAFSNIYAVLFCRALLGIALGILIPITNSLPLDYFRGPELSKVAARQSACISLGNIIFVLIAGWLAVISWRYTFLIYSIALPIMLCIFFFFPKEKYKDTPPTHTDSSKKESLPYTIYIQAAIMFFTLIAIYSYHTGVAILLQERNIGTAASAAYVLSTNSVASFFTALFIRKIHATIDKYIFPVIYLSLSLGFYCLYVANSLFFAFMAAIFIAIAMGSIMSTSSILINRQAEMNNLTKALILKAFSTVNIAIFLGQFAAPIMFDSLPNLSANPDIGGSYLTLSIIFVVSAPIVALLCRFTIKNKLFS